MISLDFLIRNASTIQNQLRLLDFKPNIYIIDLIFIIKILLIIIYLAKIYNKNAKKKFDEK